MKKYFFAIRDNKIDYLDNGTSIPVTEYMNYHHPAGKEILKYKITNGEVSDIICEADYVSTAIGAIEKFLLLQHVCR